MSAYLAVGDDLLIEAVGLPRLREEADRHTRYAGRVSLR
jgi:hypothetical protein